MEEKTKILLHKLEQSEKYIIELENVSKENDVEPITIINALLVTENKALKADVEELSKEKLFKAW